MRIAFDGSTLRPRRTGVGYYTEHLLQHLAQAAPNDDLVVLSNRPVDTTVPLPERVRILMAPRPMPRILWMQTHAAFALHTDRPDVAHFTNGMLPLVSRVPAVVTIHDMSLRLLPQSHPARRLILNRPLMDLAARRADAVITVSESAKRDIVSLYGLDPGRVRVVHEAAAPGFRPICDIGELERVREKYGLEDRIILYVGTIEPRKNLPALIEAFARRRRSGELTHQLVCVGPYGWLSSGIEDLIDRTKAAHAITFTGYVPFDELPALYSLAEMFVYPSMYEGFGLPVIEAMACGVPVIAGRAAAVAEVGGDAIEQFQPSGSNGPIDVSALGDALVRLARDGEYRRRLAAAGLARSQTFSWERAANQTLDLYHQVAEDAGRERARARSRFRLTSAPPQVKAASQRSPNGSGCGANGTGTPRRVIDVLFGQAYFLRFDPKLWKARQPYAPLGALYAASYVRDHGYQVALFDAMLATSERDWEVALDRHCPRFAVLYEDNFNYLSKMCLLRMRQAALRMVAAARTRGITTIVSGSDATDHPSTYLDAGTDAVIVGEGETTLVELLRALSDGRTAEIGSIAGLCYRDGSGAVVRTRAREVIRDLDTLPFPAWDLVDVARYQSVWRSKHGYYSMNLVTTRGCPYHCNWCAKPIYGQRYSARSAESVADEIAWLKSAYAPDHLWMADDIFGLKPGWIARFADAVEAREAAIPFKCLLRADQVTPQIVRDLKRAGCRTAWMGAESGSQRVLDSMEKGTRVDQIVTARRLLGEAGIEVGFFLQFGYPGETRDDIQRTLDMIGACRPDDIGISVSYPLPGTPFYDRVQEQLGDKQNWEDSDDLAIMYRATFVPDFYRALHALIHAEFRGRRATETLRGVGHPLRARVRAAAHFLLHAPRLPLLRRRVERFARLSPPQPPIRPVAVLTPQAAAIPSEQTQ